MQTLTAFIATSLDGFFADTSGDMRWAHKTDPEWHEFEMSNVGQGGALLFGRITYDLMASYWPTAMAKQQSPSVAEAMNNSPKYVFSRMMKEASWQNTKLIKSNLGGEVRAL